ncbi:LacI family DNA-binding transcriptional regulator [Streptomyces sp. WMMC500]|uniref:LacI family DNA-binding transcriptional regulator n=1 Tax=Streptomyces sp. WMMC500 TaxID=3015154 RepID=UPI00248D2866|nr:LacI family DNA-binding transcriptional regulator [Streptomyces sp. WMMC500]WBB62036.1 LacI family DNA-binding transcriptional regulator [Streptomyces sp. WMMC500]
MSLDEGAALARRARPGRVTRMRDVAEAAGVSVKTVSEVANGVGQVRESTRRRVLAAIEELDYRPNPAARRLNAGRTGVLTLALPQLASGFHAALASALIDMAERDGMDVVLEPTGGDPERELEILSNDSGVADGAVFEPAGLDGGAAQIVPATPIVLTGTRTLDLPVDHVVSDRGRMLDAAVTLLRGHGRERVVLLGTGELLRVPSPAGRPNSGPLTDAYPRVTTEALTQSAGYRAVADMVSNGVAFDALVALDVALALGALHALRDRAVTVPADVQVVGVGNALESPFSTPRLSTVEADVMDMARQAYKWVLDRIAGNTEPPRRHDVPFAVVERGSSGPHRAGHR